MFLGAFTAEGDVLWIFLGGGGFNPRVRVLLPSMISTKMEIDVISFFLDPEEKSAPYSLDNVTIQIRDGNPGFHS